MFSELVRGIAENSRMTDLNVAASPAVTVLAGFLNSPRNFLYHGVLTPTELDARPGEIEALASASACHDLGWLRRIAVRGRDRFRWLSGMVTNMVKDLPPGSGAWNLVLNAQGRIQGDLTIWREPPQRQGPVAGDPGESDDLELEVTADQAEKLLAHLDHFIIMDDVELAIVDGQSAMGLAGPKAADAITRLGLPVLAEPMTQALAEWNGIPVLLRRGFGVLADHYTIWIPSDQAGDLWQALTGGGVKPVGAEALEAFRIAEGIPAYGVDMVDRDLPQETSQLRALHFDKGCYLGQEIVERIRSRGNVHRHLRSLELDGPLAEPGTRLTLEGAEAGHITSAAELPLPGGVRRFAIGMIRAEAEARNLPLNYSVGEISGVANVLAVPPYLTPGMER
jgi:folate-binding protein YgfZ